MVLRLGLGRLVTRDYLVPSGDEDHLVDHLSEVMGTPLAAGVHLGPPRANRKPVLTLVTGTGEIVAFAKLGVDVLTDQLVAREAQTLRELPRPTPHPLVVPTLLHRGRWRGHELMVMSPVAIPRRPRDPDPASLVAAVRAVFTLGCERAVPIDEAVDRLRASLTRHRLSSPDMDAVVQLLDTVGTLSDDSDLVRLGPAHGDFAPGNLIAGSAEPLCLIDWERFESCGVPYGSDLLHFEFRRALDLKGSSFAGAARSIVTAAPRLLRPLAVERRAAYATVGLYLARIAGRYLVDGQAGPGRRLGPVAPWLATACRDIATQAGN